MARPITSAEMRAEIIKRVVKSQATKGSNYIKPGKYIFGIENLFFQQGRKGAQMVAEFYVEQGESYPDVLDQKTREPVLANSQGQRVGWVLNFDKHEAAMGDAKKFFMALVGETDEAKVSDDQLFTAIAYLTATEATVDADTKAVTPAQPARGFVIRDETYQHTIQGGNNAGKEIALHQWSEIPEAAEAIAARRAVYEKRLGLKQAAAV